MAKKCAYCGMHHTSECAKCKEYTTRTNVGYWRNFTDGFYCSECGARNASPADECPNCEREMINGQFWAGLSRESPGFGIPNR